MPTEYCKFCGQKIKGNKHQNICPYNDRVVKEIVLFLFDYFVKNSKFNKNFRPFPTIREFQRFLKSNKLMGLKTIRRHYFDSEMKLEDFLSELIDIAVYKRLVDDNEFPAYLRFAYDSWMFYNREEYTRMYKEAIAYEDSEYGDGSNAFGKEVEIQGLQFVAIETLRVDRMFKT